MRQTGPDAATVLAVWLRSEKACERCGKGLLHDTRGWLWSIQHRKARQMGGSKAPGINGPANLAVLCGSATTGCHGWVESHPTAAAVEGWRLFRLEQADVIPVKHHGGWRLLTDQGNYQEVTAGSEAGRP